MMEDDFPTFNWVMWTGEPAVNFFMGVPPEKTPHAGRNHNQDEGLKFQKNPTKNASVVILVVMERSHCGRGKPKV